MSVILETTIGDIVVDLFTDERPKATLNFLKLCKLKYYNYCLFFSIQRNFIAQTGDPTGTGRDGSSIYEHMYGAQARYFEMELKPRIKHSRRGLISFANNNNNMHGSQFFITLADDLDFLDGKHTVFGEVAEGLDVLEKLNETICDDEYKPYQDVRVNHTVVLHDPFDDPKGVEFPDRSPEPTQQQLESGRIGADEDLDDQAGKSKEEIEKMIEEKELRIGTQILETVGDIPDADLKPPENVLFVCKLNPVTSAEDLEIIFSRFGPILSCEVIHDQKTGDSLQYGFIEFEKVEDCEKAYFKMDNVLIDDRRIHVDFCQSVAKVKWKKSGLAAKYGMIRGDQRKEELTLKKTGRENRYDMVFDNPDIQYRSKISKGASKKEKRDRRKASGNKRKSKRPEAVTDSSESSAVSDSDGSSLADDRDYRRETQSRRQGGSSTGVRTSSGRKHSAKKDSPSSGHRKKERKRRRRKESF